MKKKDSEVVAAIEVGSNYLRMSIAELMSDGTIIILEDLFQPNTIGRDTFAKGRISAQTIKQTCEVLKGFAKLMKDYHVKIYKAIATSGLREADNSDYILERIRLLSGINVEIINTVQERFYIYKALRNNLNELDEINLKDSIIVNITSGGVEVSIYDIGLKFTEYIKIGTLRLREILFDLEEKTISFPKVMEEFIEGKVFILKSKIKNMNIKRFIGLGGELDTILDLCNHQGNYTITSQKLDKLYIELKSMNTEQIMHYYGLSAHTAELLLPAVLIFHSFLKMTKADNIYAPMISLRQGILFDISHELFDIQGKRSLQNDIISSVWYIAEKYGVENNHAAYVERMTSTIFDQTWKFHRLGDKEKLYLQVASILHDSGNYVSYSEHETHSYNIIRTQNIMGFSDRDLEIIANIARYHTSKIPTYSDPNYYLLDHKEKIIVSKLSAILKIAEAMDITHLQKIDKIEMSASNDIVYLKLYSTLDILLEKWDIMNNLEFFQEVMGIEIRLKR
jgi:exopolyphosphatase / guanosine-5'-triphosphate,3'-diphosphate pyrophosphatase